PKSGAPLVGPSPHGAVAGGCIGCHDSGPRELERGRAHAFAADRERCSGCHPGAAKEQEPVSARAEALLSVLIAKGDLVARQGGSDAERPPHARFTIRAAKDSARGRAIYDLLLLLEDKAASVHNAPYSKQLLAASESVLSPAKSP